MNGAETLLVAWLLLPFLAAFLAGLVPGLARGLVLLAAGATVAVACGVGLELLPDRLILVGTGGVALRPDGLAVPFLLLNGLVSGSVLLEGWNRARPTPFPLLLLVLLGSLNTAAVAADLMSLYVTLEISGIAAFLLVLGRPGPTNLWIGLRYLLISNAAMTLFLVGVGLLKLQHESFQLADLAGPGNGVTLTLLVIGLITKTGLFPSGLWLPRTHAEAPAEVSALLSGMVVAGGLAPLLRLAQVAPQLQPVLVVIGLASALVGVVFALRERDAKRLLAWSTVSQMGLTVLHPPVGGLLALAHGLAKATLFLCCGRVPVRQLELWPRAALPAAVSWPLLLAGASIAGVPGLLGFLAKSELDRGVEPWEGWCLSLLAVGTTALLLRLWPWQGAADSVPAPAGAPAGNLERLGLALPVTALLVAIPLLLLLLGRLPAATSGSAVVKSLAVLLAGVILHGLLGGRRGGAPPLLDLEGFEDLLGGMALAGGVLVLVLSR